MKSLMLGMLCLQSVLLDSQVEMLNRHEGIGVWNSWERYEAGDVILEITKVYMVFEDQELNETPQVKS